MNHIFIVHSGITLKIAEQIIKYKQLIYSDCIFLISRFQPKGIDKRIKTIYLDKHFNQNSFQTSIFFLKPLFNSIRLNLILKKHLNHIFFEAYLPHHVLNIYSLISNHKKCKFFSYIEEGTLSYSPTKDILSTLTNKKPSIIASLFFTLSFLGKVSRTKHVFQLNSNRNNLYYSISNLCFPELPICKKILLPSPFHNKDSISSNIKNILIIEPYIELSMISPHDYISCISKIITHFKHNKITSFHYKFHPRQSMKIKGLIADFFKSTDIPAIELNENLIIENILESNRPNIYHINSSVGIYSIIHKCKTYSLYNFAIKQSETLRKTNKGILDQFKNQTIFLK